MIVGTGAATGAARSPVSWSFTSTGTAEAAERTRLEAVIGIARELMALFGVLVLLVG